MEEEASVKAFSPQLINLNVINNNAGNEGGGIQCSNGSPTLDGLFIAGNYAGYGGGGIYLEGQAHLTISNSTIVNNSVNYNGGGNSSSSCFSCRIHKLYFMEQLY